VVVVADELEFDPRVLLQNAVQPLFQGERGSANISSAISHRQSAILDGSKQISAAFGIIRKIQYISGPGRDRLSESTPSKEW
jgi:hypothetical protein